MAAEKESKTEQRADEVEVGMLRFTVDLHIVGRGPGTRQLAAEGPFEIHYLPRIRHHRIVHRHAAQGVGTQYVPDTLCTWEPPRAKPQQPK